MITLKSGEPFIHDLDSLLQLECCNCGMIHHVEIKALNADQVVVIFTVAEKESKEK